MHTGAHILLVDDDGDCRESIAEWLELSGFTVSMAADGVAALARLRAEPPDVVLADLRMPRMNGDALLRAIRADHRLDALPVVIMTGAHERGCPEGAFAIVHKPFAPRELVGMLERALSSTRRLAACS